MFMRRLQQCGCAALLGWMGASMLYRSGSGTGAKQGADGKITDAGRCGHVTQSARSQVLVSKKIQTQEV